MSRTSKQVIRYEYELRSKDGTLIEASRAGGGRLQSRLPKAMRACLGTLALGEEQRGEVAAREVFDEQPSLSISMDEFPADVIEVGQRYEAKTVGGRHVSFEVTSVTERIAKVRFLPPPEEERLDYWIRVSAIEEAPPPPAAAYGIDSQAIQIWDSTSIRLA
jgi:FKBP-type peptidyl-prolyl cis-trans isomerase 2